LVQSLAELVAHEPADDGFDLEQATLGASTPSDVAAALTRFASDHLGPVAAGLFYKRSTGIAAGLRLTDGSEVVVRLHRWRASLERLVAVQQVQEHLARRGAPAPRPLLSPRPFGSPIVTVEEHRPGGRADGHDPHHLRFDFEATSEEAAWIDEAALLAHRRLADLGGEPVVGPLDWSEHKVGFAADRSLSAMYDWDSVALAPEAFAGWTALPRQILVADDQP
jgi:hypothetical protein